MRLPNIFEEEMLCTITGGVEACAEDPDIKKNITSSFIQTEHLRACIHVVTTAPCTKQ